MKKRASRFKQSVAKNSHKQKTQASQYGYLNLPSGMNVFKEEPDTKVTLDFLPYTIIDQNHPDIDQDGEFPQLGDLWYKRPFKVHRNIGAENEAVVCPTSIKKKCPICEYRAKRKKEGADQEELGAIKASNRNLYVVVPKNHKEYDEEPHIWDISKYLFQDMLNDEIDENKEYGVFPDPEEGLSVRIRFTENKLGRNKFAETSRIDFEQREKPYDEKILDSVPNLDEVLNIMTYEQIEKKFFEMEAEEDAGKAKEDDKEKSSEGRTRFGGKKEEKEKEKETDKDEKKDDKEKEKEKPAMQRTKDKEKEKGKEEETGSTNKCPHKHTFGEDCEKHDECDNCDSWDKCMDTREGSK